jgi:hypothetical protein
VELVEGHYKHVCDSDELIWYSWDWKGAYIDVKVKVKAAFSGFLRHRDLCSRLYPRP